MATDGAEGPTSREDRIVAEFGDGLAVEGIAFRYGLTVAQVYAVVEREVGTADHGFSGAPNHLPPPGYHTQPPPARTYAAPPSYAAPEPGLQPSQGFLDDDAIVAEYGDGNDVAWIARKHGITAERVYEVVQRVVEYDDRRDQPPTSSW